MRTGNSVMFLDLISIQKLLRIFMFVILINHNLKENRTKQ